MRISTLIFLAVSLLASPLFAQFTASLAPSSVEVPEDKMRQLNDYEIVTFAIDEVLEALPGEGQSSLSFRLETEAGTLPFRLDAFDLRGSNYHLREVGAFKQGKVHDRDATRQFRGKLGTPEGGVAIFTLDDNFVMGSWKEDGKIYYLEPLWQLWEEAPRDAYVFYSGENLREMTNFCGVEDLDNLDHDHNAPANRLMDGCLEVDYALAADFEMFQQFGSAASVENFMLNTLASAQTNYDDEFDDELIFVVVETVIATSNATDPWTNSTDGSNGLLPDFRNWGNQGGFGVEFDVATLWTNRDLDGSSIGWAYVGGVCNNRRYNICQRFSSNNAFLRVLLAHELGHNFGSNHDAGNGFIMAPSVSSATGWSVQSTNAINSYYQNQNCLNPCLPPEPPAAGIQTSFTDLCESSLVTFIDVSSGNISSRTWQFPGGNPSSSTAVAPEVTYPGPGTYTAFLTVDNDLGSSSSEIDVTLVSPDTEAATVVFHETFDGEEIMMQVSNTDGQNTWEFLPVPGNGGEKAAVINNYDNDLNGVSDYLISPDIDLSGLLNPTLSIEYAYRRYNATLSDQLRVTVNGSIGGSQVLFFGDENGSENFATGPDLADRFFPSEFSDWCFDGPSCIEIDLVDFANDPFVQIVVENINGYGNYMYVDNIILFGNCTSTLPVQWLSFTAQAKGKAAAKLEWSVNQDETHSGFMIQRANRATPSEWTDLAWVGAKAGAEGVTYSYEDRQVSPGGAYFYRLRQEDITGVTDFSPIRTVSFEELTSTSVLPNPTSGQVRVITPTGQDSYRLLDPTGREVLRGVINNQQATLDLRTLPRAVYLLRVGEEVLRVVRQ